MVFRFSYTPTSQEVGAFYLAVNCISSRLIAIMVFLCYCAGGTCDFAVVMSQLLGNPVCMCMLGIPLTSLPHVCAGARSFLFSDSTIEFMISKFKETSFYIFISHHWLTIAFVLGFVTDFLLLNRVDDSFDNLVLLMYVTLATLSLFLFYAGVAERGGEKVARLLLRLTPVIMQYSFGGLLSGMLIFYGRSGDLLVSAPFLLIILGVILANELVEKKSNRLLYNLTVYFIGLFSYLVLMVPVLLGEMGDVIFVGSGFLAVLIMMGLLKVLSYVIPHYLVLQKRLIVFTIATLYVFFNFLYFTNIIPPIPLSLTELSIYQDIERTSIGGYRILKEEPTWWQVLTPFLTPTFSPVPGGGAYCFARVYAPTSLKVEVVHRWEYYEERTGDWVTRFTQPYTVTSENKNGYRGYTVSNNLVDGKWRCSVETKRGQVLGRETFTVDMSRNPDRLVTVVE